jgi:hypothetical protein
MFIGEIYKSTLIIPKILTSRTFLLVEVNTFGTVLFKIFKFEILLPCLVFQVELQEASPRLGKVVGAEQEEGADDDVITTTARPASAGGAERKSQAGSSKRVVGSSHSELTNSVLPPSEPRPVASNAGPDRIVRQLLLVSTVQLLIRSIPVR